MMKRVLTVVALISCLSIGLAMQAMSPAQIANKQNEFEKIIQQINISIKNGNPFSDATANNFTKARNIVRELSDYIDVSDMQIQIFELSTSAAKDFSTAVRSNVIKVADILGSANKTKSPVELSSRDFFSSLVNNINKEARKVLAQIFTLKSDALKLNNEGLVSDTFYWLSEGHKNFVDFANVLGKIDGSSYLSNQSQQNIITSLQKDLNTAAAQVFYPPIPNDNLLSILNKNLDGFHDLMQFAGEKDTAFGVQDAINSINYVVKKFNKKHGIDIELPFNNGKFNKNIENFLIDSIGTMLFINENKFIEQLQSAVQTISINKQKPNSKDIKFLVEQVDQIGHAKAVNEFQKAIQTKFNDPKLSTGATDGTELVQLTIDNTLSPITDQIIEIASNNAKDLFNTWINSRKDTDLAAFLAKIDNTSLTDLKQLLKDAIIRINKVSPSSLKKIN